MCYCHVFHRISVSISILSNPVLRRVFILRLSNFTCVNTTMFLRLYSIIFYFYQLFIQTNFYLNFVILYRTAKYCHVWTSPIGVSTPKSRPLKSLIQDMFLEVLQVNIVGLTKTTNLNNKVNKCIHQKSLLR